MHLQIRAIPAKSPADLKAFLEVLAAADINIVAAGGSNLEQGGEFAFAVTHGQEDEAIRLLKEAGYQPRALDASVATEDGAVFTTCWMTDEPGQLLGLRHERDRCQRGSGPGHQGPLHREARR